MGRKSLKDEQQKKIIEAFYEVAKKEGIENTSFAKIGKELNMPPSLIVHYFKSKEELLLGLINFIVESYKGIYQTEAEPENPLNKLTSILDNIFSRKWDLYIDDSVFYNCFTLTFRNDAIRNSFKELHLLLRSWLTDAIRDCTDKNLLDIEDPEKTADLIFVISDGAYYFLSMLKDDDLYNERLANYKREAFRLLKLV